MTWIIGVPGLEFGFLVGDVQVCYQYADGRLEPRTDIGVQKIFGIVDHLAGGFAGSIEMGFALLNDLERFVGATNVEHPRTPPVGLLHRWEESGRPQEIFSRAPQMPTNLLIAYGTVASVANPDRRAERGFGMYVVRTAVLRSPEFSIEDVPPPQVASIGSGTAVFEAARAVVADANQRMAFWHFAQSASPGGAATMLSASLTTAMSEVVPQDPSVSPLLLGAMFSASGVAMFSNEPHTESSPPPRIARSWADLSTVGIPTGATAVAPRLP